MKQPYPPRSYQRILNLLSMGLLGQLLKEYNSKKEHNEESNVVEKNKEECNRLHPPVPSKVADDITNSKDKK